MRTPGSIAVHKSYADLYVVCEKEGYKKSVKTIKSNIKPMIMGNAVFGGAIGAGIDAADGAAYDYPTQISLALTRNS